MGYGSGDIKILLLKNRFVGLLEWKIQKNVKELNNAV